MSAGDWKEMFRAACEGDLALVEHHLDHGVDVDFSHPEFQSTALVASILAGQEPVAHLLLDRGADPLLRSELDDCTPVEAAHLVGPDTLRSRLRSLDPGAPDLGAHDRVPPGRVAGRLRAAWSRRAPGR